MQIKKKKALIVIITFFSITVIGSYQYFSTQKNDISQAISIKEEKNNLVNINLPTASTQDKMAYLQEKYQNEEIKAILSIDNDNFSYPVVQTGDNDYYLTHNIEKNRDALGAIYADYRVNLNGGKKILIFGHSSTIHNTPFNHLESYYDEEYFNTHQTLTLETENNIYHYKIFSVYVETSDFTYMNLNFSTPLKWYAHIKNLQEKSWYPTKEELTENDDILILQTCSNHPKYKNDKNKYLLIISRREI